MRILRFYRTSVGKKVVVALTGLFMFGFLIGHMAGNLKVFMGAAAFDHYAEALRGFMGDFVGEMVFLWVFRVLLLAAVVLHVVTVIQLARQNRGARPQPYAKNARRTSTLSSRYMMYSGLLLLIFIVFHILHFTTGTVRPSPFEYGKVYANVYGSFRMAWVAGLYVAAMAIVAWHLYHGVWSLCQTLGINNPDRGVLLKRFSAAAAVVIFVGFSVVPISMYLNLTEPVPAEHAHSEKIVEAKPATPDDPDARSTVRQTSDAPTSEGR